VYFQAVCRGMRIAKRVNMMSSLKVLIVEDDNAMAQMCAKLIRRRGHSAVIAGSCHDALTIVRSGQDVDAVITDIQMPQMTGIELLARLHEFDSQLPVIVMTGYANLLGPDQAMVHGAADYLTKPFDPDALIGSLERVLNARHPVG
jgi:DNA-binding NtrC family response regulator